MPPPCQPTTLKRRDFAFGRLSSAPENPSPTAFPHAKRALAVETRAPLNSHPPGGEPQAAIATRLIAVRSAFEGRRSAAADGISDPNATPAARIARAIDHLLPARRTRRGSLAHVPVRALRDPASTSACDGKADAYEIGWHRRLRVVSPDLARIRTAGSQPAVPDTLIARCPIRRVGGRRRSGNPARARGGAAARAGQFW
jgi:hypothetical protein